MKKTEFEKEVKKLGLKRANLIKTKYNEDVSYYIDKKQQDIYGLYKNEEKKYTVFYKTVERNITRVIGEYGTKEEAYDELLNELKKNNKNSEV